MGQQLLTLLLQALRAQPDLNPFAIRDQTLDSLNTSITYMGIMLMTSVVIFIEMGRITVVENDVLHDTSLLQCSDGSINILFQCKLRCNMLKIFCTKRSILVG